MGGHLRLYADSGGTIWAGSQSGGGLSAIDPDTGHITRYLPDPSRPDTIHSDRVRCMVADGKGLLYVGTENGGLEVLDLATQRFHRYLPKRGDVRSIGAASIYALLFDDQGILWVGTYNAGLSYTSEAQSRFGVVRATREDELSDPHVSAILEDRAGDLWVGTDGGGLNRFVPGASRTIVYRHDPRDDSTIGSDAIQAILEDGEGRFWLGGWDAGLGLMDRRTGRVTTYRHGKRSPLDNIFRIVEDGPRDLIVTSFGGVERFDRTTRTFSPFGLVGDSIPSAGTIGRDRGGNLWFGSSAGVFRVESGTNRCRKVQYDPNDPTSLGPGAANAFLLDSRGNFWIGFENGGLRCLPASGGATRAWTSADGLLGDSAKAILEDEAGNLWVSTDRGISRLEGASALPDKIRFDRFELADGLQGSEFRFNAAFKSPRGEMFFGGQKGFNRFFPSRIRFNAKPPEVVLTGLRLFNRIVKVGEPRSPLQHTITETSEITLAHDQSVVTFEFAALNFVLPKKNRYRYKLEPLEKEWNDAGRQSTATYTLSPGRYVFKVKAANNDGVWSERETALRVRVKPPFYLTVWAYALDVVTVFGAFFAWYRWRVREMASQHRELERVVDERTAQLASSALTLQAKSDALAQENEERRRAEEDARRAAEEIALSNRKLEQQRIELERQMAERQKAEQEAGRERDLLHALMDNTPDSIYFKDRQSRFTRINRARAQALGVATPEEAVGRSDADFFPAELARSAFDDEQQMMRSGKPVIGRLEHDQKNGRWFLSSKAPLRDATGEVAGLIGISKDITESKLAEQKLERDLGEFLAVVNEVSRGDLTRYGEEGPELLGRIASSFNAMLGSFSGILTDVRDTIVAVSTHSEQILAAATQIAKGAQYGSDQVHHTSTAVEEMAAAMVQVSRDSEASALAAKTVLEHVHEGELSVNAAFEGMERIDSAVGQTAEKMKLLDHNSRQIFDVIELIQDIASQSELLSFNAAIQAAHAGEAGRGFAVVADEIRRLAERSRGASRDVSRIVEGIVEEVKTVLGAMRLAMNEVRTERGLSEKARGSLQEIESQVAKSALLASQISYASREQAEVTRMLAMSMQSLARVTAESASGASDTSQAVELLVALSSDLTQAIERFRFVKR